MNKTCPPVGLASRALGAAACVASLASASAGRAAVVVTEAWSRPTFAGAPSAVGYLRVANPARSPDRLMGGRTPSAARLEIHQTTVVGGVTRMRAVESGVMVAAGGVLALTPGGYHLMFVAPRRAFKVGDRVRATLRFERAGDVPVAFEVRAAPGAAMAPGMVMR